MVRFDSNVKAASTATCPQCRGRMREEHIEVKHAHAGLSLKVKAVPAWVCGSCGKRLVTNDIADRLNRLLDEVAGKNRGKRIQ